jgi:hypothetical protein
MRKIKASDKMMFPPCGVSGAFYVDNGEMDQPFINKNYIFYGYYGSSSFSSETLFLFAEIRNYMLKGNYK